jgi:hypothetical protein
MATRSLISSQQPVPDALSPTGNNHVADGSVARLVHGAWFLFVCLAGKQVALYVMLLLSSTDGGI